jgi:site-specific recombinase XerD
VLSEYVADLKAQGNNARHVTLVGRQIQRVIAQAKFKEFAQVEPVAVTRAIAKLMAKHGFTVITANRNVDAMRARTHWMCRNNRWPTNPLEKLAQIKGDTNVTRRRAILTSDEFAKLLATTLASTKVRCNLSPEQRYYLYLVAGCTGARAGKCHSLTPSSFDFSVEPTTLTIDCTILR